MPAVALQLLSSPAVPHGVIQRDAEPVVARGGDPYEVQRGDSLWRISEQTYGSGIYWRRIKRNNPDVVRGESLIHPRDILNLPVIEVPISGELERERNDPESLRDLVTSIPDDNYAAFREQLTQDEIEAQGEFLQLVDLMRRTGMTIEEMSAEQARFMEGQASALGQTIGEFIASETASRGYGGGTATWWPSLTPEEQDSWQVRFDAAVAWLRSNAPEGVQEVIRVAEANGGGFVWAPARCEELGAFGFTSGDWRISVGRRWLEAYDGGPDRIYSNLVHELGGHNEYGNTLGWEVMTGVLESMDPTERALAEGGGNSLYSAYGYMETELWAELREEEFVGPHNPTDLPTDDVQRQLERIKHAFAPAIAEALVRSIHQRAMADDRITEGARQILVRSIVQVFGFTP